MAQGQPVFILPENISRMIGRDAQRNNIMAARLVAETVKSTLGPRGMDKMLVDSIGDITVTNDGVTILEEMQIEHPAAKMMVEIAKTQEAEVGDGTTTAVVIAGELLKNAEKLLDQDIHPTVVARGYRLASEQAIKVLHEISTKIDRKDRALLVKIAATAITGKGAESARDMLAELIVDSVLQVSEGNEVDLDSIKIEKKKGKSISQSELIKGIVLDKERVHPDMPKHVENAKIALLDCALEIKGPETDTKVSISSPDQLQAFLDQEEKMLKGMVEKVKKSGANVVFCQKGIDDVAQYYFARAGILAARRIKKSDMEKLAKATTGRIASNLNESVNAGETAVVEVAVRNRGTKIEEDVFVKASIPELGISRQKFIGDLLPLEDFENEDNELSDKAVALLRLEIPAGTVSGDYALKIQVYSSDGVAKGEETAILSVKGKTAAPVQTSGSAVAIDSSAKTVAKEQGVVYKVTVTNLGSSAQTYTAEVSGVDFGTYSANPGILTLAAGQSGEFNIFVSPAATSTLGAHAFSVAVKADGTVAKTLSLSADVTDSSAGNDRLRQNLIVIAVILIAILIILAIIIAVVTGRRREESEERLY